jgi:hypothetical protein
MASPYAFSARLWLRHTPLKPVLFASLNTHRHFVIYIVPHCHFFAMI